MIGNVRITDDSCCGSFKPVNSKFILLSLSFNEDYDVISHVQLCSATAKVGGKSENNTSVNSLTSNAADLAFCEWLIAPNSSILRAPAASKKPKNVLRPTKRDEKSMHMNTYISDSTLQQGGLRRFSYNDFGSKQTVEKERFSFYHDSDAYIKSYQLMKRSLLGLGNRRFIPSGDLANESKRSGSADRLREASAGPSRLSSATSGLHLHIARVLKSFLADNLQNETNDSLKQAQNKWFEHLCDEVSQLEERNKDANKGVDFCAPDNDGLTTATATEQEQIHEQETSSEPAKEAKTNLPEFNFNVVGRKLRKDVRYGVGSGKVVNPSLNVVSCEVFPSLETISMSQKLNRTNQGRETKKTTNSGDKAGILSSQSSKLLDVFSMIGGNQYRYQAGSDTSSLCIGSNK